MKKVLLFAMFTILLMGFVLAIENNSNSLNNSDDEEDSEDGGLMGASCGTVTPGENNECCINKGYSGWDQEEFKCIKEKEDSEDEQNDSQDDENELNDSEDEEDDCEAWKCTQWSPCLNETKERNCIKTLFNCTEDNKIPELTKDCHVKEELKLHGKLRDCPEGCVCSGSSIKCMFENGTREMTIFAGKDGNIIVQIKNMNMSTNVTLYKNEEGKIYGTFKGNKTHEVKLPDEIKERLQNHTRVRLYNESIDLDENGEYHMNATKKGRLFFMFPVKEKVEYSVDSETGEVISTNTVWWGFLARDVREKSED
jgi:hypothetical protein